MSIRLAMHRARHLCQGTGLCFGDGDLDRATGCPARRRLRRPRSRSTNLLQMSPAELEAIYRQGTAVAIPEGRIRGTAILSPGTRRARVLSRGARLIWQGKVFEPGQTTAVNRFFGMRGGPRPGLSGPQLARRPAVAGARLQPDLARLRRQSRRDPPGRPRPLPGPHVRPDDRSAGARDVLRARSAALRSSAS